MAELGCLKFAEIAARTQPKPEIRRTAEQPAIVVGEVEAIRRRGDSMAFAKLADGTGASLEVGFFKDSMARYPHLLKEGERIVVAGGLSWDGFSSNWQLKVRQAYSVDDALLKACREIKITISGAGVSFVSNLKALLTGYQGGNARVRLKLEFDEGGVELELGAEWRVRGTLALKAALLKLGGVRAVNLSFSAELLSEEASSASEYVDSAPPWAA